MLANPEGPLMTSSCKEKDAAWEFIKFICSGDALMLYTGEAHGAAGAQVARVNNPVFQSNRFIKMSLAESGHLVDAAVRAQELDQFPGQDSAVLAGNLAREDLGQANFTSRARSSCAGRRSGYA